MLLLQHGAQVDTTTKDMYTALHIAAKEGQDEVTHQNNNLMIKDNNKNKNSMIRNVLDNKIINFNEVFWMRHKEFYI